MAKLTSTREFVSFVRDLLKTYAKFIEEIIKLERKHADAIKALNLPQAKLWGKLAQDLSGADFKKLVLVFFEFQGLQPRIAQAIDLKAEEQAELRRKVEALAKSLGGIVRDE